VEKLVEEYVKPIVEQQCPQQSRAIHFVTHSLGGILVRYYHDQYGIPKLHRVVMLSPPNRGSELVDRLGGFFLFKWINGPAGMQLSTAETSLPNRLGRVDFDLAVIAGSRSLNPFYSSLIPGEDDGKVAVARARLEGMRAFRIVAKTHTYIMRNYNVISLVVGYLKRGSFNSPSEKGEQA
jgi:hypothetical protein